MRKIYDVFAGGELLASPVYIADSFGSRFCGLMLRRSLAPGEGLLLKKCPSIHCFFMRFTIDAVYLDRDMTVVGTETVKPWRVGGSFRGARHVLEVAEGAAHLVRAGMKLEVKESASDE